MDILMPVETEEEYERALRRISDMESDAPDPEAEEGREFAALLKLVDQYEREQHGEVDDPSPGTVLEQRMTQLGLSQREVAERTEIPEPRISEMIHDKRRPSRRQIEKLSRFFDISADLLVVKDPDSAAAE